MRPDPVTTGAIVIVTDPNFGSNEIVHVDVLLSVVDCYQPAAAGRTTCLRFLPSGDTFGKLVTAANVRSIRVA